MDDFFYGLSSWTIALTILALMLLAMEAGFRIGLRGQASSNPESRSQISTVLTSLLGILALLLGFTFSIALDRYSGRSLAVVNEANAIGTAFLRTDLLPEPARSDARRAFADYADVRARMSVLTWNQKDERIAMQARVLELQDGLWRQAAEASQQAPNPATTGLYVQSLNEMIDAYSSYMAELLRLKQIVDAARSGPILYLLDEILHGTNTTERRIAARSVIRQLVETGSIGVVSTHDLELVDAGLAGAAVLVHLVDQVVDGPNGPEMVFDYRLWPGLAPSSNALRLLNLVGLGEESPV